MKETGLIPLSSSPIIFTPILLQIKNTDAIFSNLLDRAGLSDEKYYSAVPILISCSTIFNDFGKRFLSFEIR